MLHYYPYLQKGNVQADWCGWHNDLGCLTCLTSAMYMDENGKQITLKNNDGGLFAKDRHSQTTRISIPENMCAYQIGEIYQIASGGYLQATPHSVLKHSQIAGKNVSRQTFVVFMDPNLLYKLQIPEGALQSNIKAKPVHGIFPLQHRWKNGMYFKDFKQITLKQHY